MEHELRLNLLRCAKAYATARRLELPTVGRLAAGDWRFFDRLEDDEKTFTARKYDDVMQWFSDNWPEDKSWPARIDRPSAERARAGAA